MRTPQHCLIVLSLLLWVCPALAIINPKLTPVQVAQISPAILWGNVSATKDAAEWSFQIVDAVKGKTDRQAMLLSLARCKPEERAGVRAALKAGPEVAILFLSARDRKNMANMHVGGVWLTLRNDGQGRWNIEGTAAPLAAVYAGGTDMLLRMVRYILTDPAATVPVAVGASWMAEPAHIGTVPGEIFGMETIELTADATPHVFVASSKGDRLFRAQKGAEAFDDVTGKFKLASRSRQFTWACLTANGRPSLVSWDGAVIAVWTLDAAGVLQPDPDGLPWKRPCLALSACSLPQTGAPAILVSTPDRPVLIHRSAQAQWVQTPLPDGELLKTLGESNSACIVADLDGDGFWEVLQPRTLGGVLWKGRDDGFAAPIRSDVACPDGPGRAAIGDFDEDGFLDIFLAGSRKNELWENDGHARFRPVAVHAGTLGYKCPVGLSACRVADLNHDGRPDLLLAHPEGAFTYHFNRGFRCFGEEGDLRLPRSGGQVACTVADFNADGSLDLAVAFADGEVHCFFNDSFNKPLLRVGLPPDLPGPVTASVWQGKTQSLCIGTASIAGPARAYFALRSGRDCTIKWAIPGQPARTREVHLPDDLPGNGVQVMLSR